MKGPEGIKIGGRGVHYLSGRVLFFVVPRPVHPRSAVLCFANVDLFHVVEGDSEARKGFRDHVRDWLLIQPCDLPACFSFHDSAQIVEVSVILGPVN